MAAAQPFQQWIEAGETQTPEFKSSFNKACIETLVAFANAKGGRVLVAVTNTGTVQGVTLGNESLNDWLVQIKAATSPSMIPELEAHHINIQAWAEYPELQPQIEEISGEISIAFAKNRLTTNSAECTAGNPGSGANGGANGGANDDADATASVLNLLRETPGQKAHDTAAAKAHRTIELVLRKLRAQDASEFRGATKSDGHHLKH